MPLHVRRLQGHPITLCLNQESDVYMTTEKEMEKVEREEYERTAGGESVDSKEELAEESRQALMDSYRWQGVI